MIMNGGEVRKKNHTNNKTKKYVYGFSCFNKTYISIYLQNYGCNHVLLYYVCILIKYLQNDKK